MFGTQIQAVCSDETVSVFTILPNKPRILKTVLLLIFWDSRIALWVKHLAQLREILGPDPCHAELTL